MKIFLTALVMFAMTVGVWAEDKPITNSAGMTENEQEINEIAKRMNVKLYDLDYMKKQQSLLGDYLIPIGGMGGYSGMFTLANGKFAYMSGGGGGMVLFHQFVIGGVGYGGNVGETTYITGTTTNTGAVSVGFGGLYLGYILMPESMIHGTIYAVLGSGGALTTPVAANKPIVTDPNPSYTIYPFSAYMIGATVDFNLADMVRFSVGGGYRIISGIDQYNYAGLTDAKLSGAYGNVSVSMGWF